MAGKRKSKVARFDVLTAVLPTFRFSVVCPCVFFLSDGLALVDEGTALPRNVGKNVITLRHIPDDLNPQGQVIVFAQSLSDFGDILVIGETFSKPYQAYTGKPQTTAFAR
jgi:hypothetical protein